ncbi:hypothetical protein [Corallococcus sp. 4LFB]|uniref:hypothetical protein n=1 Tax=Corallococcus sp. 4LFB TaxID=3383249 RepID=UPI0039750AED
MARGALHQLHRRGERAVGLAVAPGQQRLPLQGVWVARVLLHGGVEALLRELHVARDEVGVEARERERARRRVSLTGALGGGLEHVGRDDGGGPGAAGESGDEC